MIRLLKPSKLRHLLCFCAARCLVHEMRSGFSKRHKIISVGVWTFVQLVLYPPPPWRTPRFTKAGRPDFYSARCAESLCLLATSSIDCIRMLYRPIGSVFSSGEDAAVKDSRRRYNSSSTIPLFLRKACNESWILGKSERRFAWPLENGRCHECPCQHKSYI